MCVCVFKEMTCVYTMCGCVAGLKFNCSIYAISLTRKNWFVSYKKHNCYDSQLTLLFRGNQKLGAFLFKSNPRTLGFWGFFPPPLFFFLFKEEKNATRKCKFIKIMERTWKGAVSLNIASFSRVSPNVFFKTGLDDQNILKVMLQVTSNNL